MKCAECGSTRVRKVPGLVGRVVLLHEFACSQNARLGFVGKYYSPREQQRHAAMARRPYHATHLRDGDPCPVHPEESWETCRACDVWAEYDREEI